MKWSLDRKILIGVGIVLAALVVNAIVSYRATSALINHQRLVSHTHQVLTELESTMSTMKDAETGERGFIITGDTRYLEPYQTAIQLINDHVSKLKELSADNSNQQVRIPVLEQKIKLRLATLEQGINRKKNNDVEGVRQLIISGAGKAQMDDLRQFIDLMERDEQDLLKQRSEEASASGRYAFITDFIPNLIACGLLLLVAYVLFGDITARRKVEEELRRQREWLAVTLASIGDAVIATDTNGAVTFVNPIA
jgi:two-component system, cell cycle sensor histidine kinase and response regulator CckA